MRADRTVVLVDITSALASIDEVTFYKCPEGESDLFLKTCLNLGVSLFDSYDQQLADYIKLSTVGKPQPAVGTINLNRNEYGVLESYISHGYWVFYPWRKAMVHLLDEEKFVAVRTVRNRYKITPEEQDVLRGKKVGVIGLSVGSAVAIVLAMERICGTLRLADFDKLELSNLNRINTSVLNLGVSKAVAIYRQIMELDPYLKVELFHEGINDQNIESFVLGDEPLDLVVEECDSGDVKLLTRIVCRKYRIPVVMETSDRGLLDVERFDQELERSLLHGMLQESDYRPDLGPEEKRSLLLKSIDFSRVSTRGLASMQELGKTISNWPQLASDVVSGGAHAAMAVRLILLGESVKSGRVYVDAQYAIERGLGSVSDHPEAAH